MLQTKARSLWSYQEREQDKVTVKIVVLAGGLGTRLKGVLEGLPKPMVPINNMPFLEYLLLHFKSQNFTEFIMSCGYAADKIRNHFGDGRRFGLSIQYTVEEELLGTGGAIKLAEPLIVANTFIMVNGDTYFQVDLDSMVLFHSEKKAVVTMALAHKEDTGRYGKVLLDRNSMIKSFKEKSESKAAGYINGGIYVFEKRIFDYIEPERACSLEKEILPLLVGSGLYGFPVNGYFIDIGVPEDYEKAKNELPGIM